MTTRGPQTPGEGKNSKRHDLERQATPGLAGSDLQVGDVAEMEAGLQAAPINKGGRPRTAAPQQAKNMPASRQVSDVDMGDMSSIVNKRLGGTFDRNAAIGKPDQALQRRGQSWMNFLQNLSRQPGASPLLRATVQSQVVRQVQSNAFQNRGGFQDLSDVDDALGGLGGGTT